MAAHYQTSMLLGILAFLLLIKLPKAYFQPNFSKLQTHRHPLQIDLSPSSSTTIPILTWEEYQSISWSQEPQILSQGHGHVIYHNYTILSSEDGRQYTRWTKREYIEDVRLHALKLRRGFITTIPGHWPGRNPTCPITISMCYIDSNSRDKLSSIVNEGIKRWHDALGRNKGIQFRILTTVICGGAEWKPSTVQIKYKPNSAKATLGFVALHNVGSNYLNFDPYTHIVGTGNPPVTSADVALWADIAGALTHELVKEQLISTVNDLPLTLDTQVTFLALTMNTNATTQQPTSISNAKTDNYDAHAKDLLANPKRVADYNRPLTITDICTRQDLARQLDFMAYKYLPYQLDDGYDHTYAMLQMLPPFDEKSIMMYSSAQYDRPIITWKKDGSRIKGIRILLRAMWLR